MGRMPITVSLIALAPLGVVGLAAGPATAETTCDGEVPSIVAVPGTPTAGTPGDDVILGTYARDEIDGGAGNDTICGLGNADTLVGGPGDDRLFGGLDDYYVPDDGYAGDTLVPGPGNDFIDLGDDPASATVDYVDQPANYDRVVFEDAPGPVTVDLSAGTATGEGTDTIVVPTYSGGIVGSAYDDVLTGTNAPDRIRGGGGDDRIHALDGDDNIEPGKGDDVVRGGDGGDAIVSPDKGRDRLYGDDGKDFVEARGRGSAIGGGAGDDYLVAHLGATVHGGPGNDEIGADLTRRTRTEVDGGGGRRDVVPAAGPEVGVPAGLEVRHRRAAQARDGRRRKACALRGRRGRQVLRASRQPDLPGRPRARPPVGERWHAGEGVRAPWGRHPRGRFAQRPPRRWSRSRPARRWFRAGPVHRRRAATAVRGAPLTRSERGSRTGHAGEAYRRGGAAATRGLWPGGHPVQAVRTHHPR